MATNPAWKRIHIDFMVFRPEGVKRSRRRYRAEYCDDDVCISTQGWKRGEVKARLERMLVALGKGKTVRGIFRWIVTIDIADVWVADGFDLDDHRLEKIVMNELGWATGEEATGVVLSTPDPERIAKVQGYKSAADKRAMDAAAISGGGLCPT